MAPSGYEAKTQEFYKRPGCESQFLEFARGGILLERSNNEVLLRLLRNQPKYA